MINFLKLYFGHLKNSRRLLLVATIGFIAALTLVASTNYYYDNSKGVIINGYFLNTTQIQSQPDVTLSVSSSFNTLSQSLTELSENINETQSQYNINYFKTIHIFPSLYGLFIPVNISQTDIKYPSYSLFNSSVSIVELNSQYLTELSQIMQINSLMNNSRLPQATSGIPQVFVLSTYQLLNKEEINFISDKNNETMLYSLIGSAFKVNPINVSITGIASFNFQNNNGPIKYPYLSAILNSNQNQASEFTLFVASLRSFSKDIQGNSILSSSASQANSINLNYAIQMNVNYSLLDPYSISYTITRINSFLKSLSFQLAKTQNFFNISYSFNSENEFASLSIEMTGFLFSLLLVAVPVILASLFVINYSFRLIHRQVVKNIGIYKTRGGTAWLMFFFQVFDNILIILLSIIVAIFTGIPLSMLAIKTNYLLSFQYPLPSYYILNFQAVSLILLYIAVALSVIVNLRRTKQLSQIEIRDTENPVEKSKSFWEKHYLDYIFFLFGIIMYFVFYQLVTNANTSSLLSPLVITILSILVLPAPFALVIGLILIVNRLIPVILNKIGTVLWEGTGNLIAYSFKNFQMHKQASIRGILLITILISFLIFFYALPYSFIVNNKQNLYYNYGAKGTGQFEFGYNESSLKVIQSNFSKYLNSFSPYIVLDSSSNYGNFKIMLVNISTYLQSAYLNYDLGLTKNINKDFTNLAFNPSTYAKFPTMNVLINNQSLINNGENTGHSIAIVNYNNLLILDIIDSFQNWPFITVGNQDQSVLMIGDINYYLHGINMRLGASPWNNIVSQGVFFNFKDGGDQSKVANWIEGNTSIENIVLPSEQQKDYYTGLQFRLQIGQVNSGILMLLALVIIVEILFSYLQLTERRKEIFTERAIGMKWFQIASLFFIENLILIIISIVIGIGIGVFLMDLLGLILFSSPTQTNPSPLFESTLFDIIIVLFDLTISKPT